MGIFAELKRRNVIRVAVAYVVLGWVVLQVTDILGPALHLPDWTLSLVAMMGLVGFPFVLLFSWAYEVTPDGIKPEHEVQRSQSITYETGRKVQIATLILLVVAIGLQVLEYTRTGQEPEVGAGQAGEPTARADGVSSGGVYDSIAVLPFQNMSSDGEQEFLSDGISEELLNALARLRSLKVAARTSSFAFKNRNTDIREIGEILNVATVLEGSLRKSGQRLRITAQLIDVHTGYHLWSQTYDRELTDIFAIQDDITAQIVSALRVHLEAGETAPLSTPTNTDAYEAYMKGRQALYERTLKAIEYAADRFEAATRLDPEFALAWSGWALAVKLQAESNYGQMPLAQAMALSNEFIDRALALEPELPDAYAVRALNWITERRYDKALSDLDRALAGKPGMAEFHMWRSEALVELGRYGDGHAAFGRAYEMDPLHPAILHNRVLRYCLSGERNDTEIAARLAEVEARYPGSGAQAEWVCHLAQGELAEAYRTIKGIDQELEQSIPMLLLDCDARWFGPGDRGEVLALPHALYCQGVAAAQSVYDSLSVEQRQSFFVQEYHSIMALRLGDYVGSVQILDGLFPQGVPPSNFRPFPNSNSNLRLNRAFALRQLGRAEEAEFILTTERQLLDQAVADGMRREQRMIEAKLTLLEGDHERALGILETHAGKLGLTWTITQDPVYLQLIGVEALTPLAEKLTTHINGEREKLGWQPISEAMIVAGMQR